MTTFNVIRLPGLNTDCMGNYLAALGLLAVTAKKWPSTRGCWIDGAFALLSKEIDDVATLSLFLKDEWTPTKYERWWKKSQSADTKAKSSARIRAGRATESAANVALLDSHVVGTGRNVFNPVFGTGGNVGKRDLSKLFAKAAELCTKPQAEEWLESTFSGECEISLPAIKSAGTWFVFANKTFNSGRKWAQEDGYISPWSILLATEGALLLSGGVNRRLSARARPYAVFPFVSEPASPKFAGEVRATTAEFWAPIWQHPMTFRELRAMLRRGFAQLGNRTAKSPHEFAVAAISAGVDVGITEFARYELRQTTSSQVYEAIPQPRIEVGNTTENEKGHHSSLLMELITSGWVDSLPYEPRDSKQRGKFTGLRGLIESGITQVAERPDDPERWRSLLLHLASVQQKVDRNQRLRQKRSKPIPPLSRKWLSRAWEPRLPPEVELACAIASLGTMGGCDQFAFNVYGIRGKFSLTEHKLWFPKARPRRAVWNSGDPLQTLLRVVQRRLIDADDEERPAPFAATYLCSAQTLSKFLTASLDLDEIAGWLPALALIDWSGDIRQPDNAYTDSLNGTELAFALVKPFFHGTYSHLLEISDGEKLFENRDRKPGPHFLRKLFHHLRFNEIDRGIQLAISRYRANGHSIIDPGPIEADGERIAAALMIPMRHSDVASGLNRWLKPMPTNI